MLNVFSPELWIVICSLFLLFLVFSLVLKPKLIRPWNRVKALTDRVWSWFFHFTSGNTHSAVKLGSLAFRLMLTLTALFTIHSLSLYQGGLLSQLVKQEPYRAPFQSVDDVVDLISSGQALLNLVDDQDVDEDLMPNYEHFSRALQNNPPVYLKPWLPKDYLRMLELSADRLFISIDDEANLVDLITDNSCDYVYVLTPYLLVQAVILTPHVNDTLRQCLDEAISENMALIINLLEIHRKHHLAKYARCRHQMIVSQSRRVGDPIRLQRLAASFLLLIGGLVVAAMAVVGERCRGRRGSDEVDLDW